VKEFTGFTASVNMKILNSTITGNSIDKITYSNGGSLKDDQNAYKGYKTQIIVKNLEYRF
jgi:hypothetical protein